MNRAGDLWPLHAKFAIWRPGGLSEICLLHLKCAHDHLHTAEIGLPHIRVTILSPLLSNLASLEIVFMGRCSFKSEQLYPTVVCVPAAMSPLLTN